MAHLIFLFFVHTNNSGTQDKETRNAIQSKIAPMVQNTHGDGGVMKQFNIYNILEYRTDDPTWLMWRVQHTDGKDYLLAYSNGELKEVYFVGEGIDNYFMSCRATDLDNISHYYVDRKRNVIRRYEKGICNRVYRDNRDGTMECPTHKYIQKQITTEPIDPVRLYNDLCNFLDIFYSKYSIIKKPTYVV